MRDSSGWSLGVCATAVSLALPSQATQTEPPASDADRGKRLLATTGLSSDRAFSTAYSRVVRQPSYRTQRSQQMVALTDPRLTRVLHGR